jgi:two-component system sensor histidine kinase KdpD
LRWLGAAAALGTATALGARLGLNASTIGFVYLIVVLLISTWGGLLLGTASSVAATLCFNFYFLPPLHTLRIAEPANWVALAAFLFASVVASRLVIAARQQAESAERRRRELATLYELSVDLFSAGRENPAVRDALERLRRDASQPAIDSAERLVTLAEERERLLEERAHVEALRESETLKTSLLRAISHDLTSPITAITLETESLARRAGGNRELEACASAIAEETARLRRRIDNLLSMARLEAGKTKPRIEPAPPADLFRAVRENLPRVTLSVHVYPDCPDANIDPSLALEILVNLVENAHRASPGTPVSLVARPLGDDRVCLEILDRGPGLPPDPPQGGLGLEIARALTAANGGTLGLTPREGGGMVARLDFPAAVLAAMERA